MNDRRTNQAENDALQSGAGQDAVSTGAQEDRDVGRDGELASAPVTPANPD